MQVVGLLFLYLMCYFYGAAKPAPGVTLTTGGLWCQKLSSLCREHSVVITRSIRETLFLLTSPALLRTHDWFPPSSLQRKALYRELFKTTTISHLHVGIHPILQLLSAHAEVTDFAQALDLGGLTWLI